MKEENQKPTIEEQYACAVMSGASGDRLIFAAGLQRERVGVLLLRLRAEYDTVRGEMERAGQIAPSAAKLVHDMRLEEQKTALHARRMEALALTETDPLKRSQAQQSSGQALARCAALATEVAAIQRRTPAETMCARAVILVSLTSLTTARQELGALAVRMAVSPKRGLPPDVALRLAGRVLDVWLDETCHKCDGTGVLGSRYQGDAERHCPTCKGTGHRRDIMGDSLQQTRFAGDLLAEVQRQVAAAAAGIKAAIYADSGPSKAIHPELVRRLAELRGVQAAVD